jgi:hypothetical protein
MYCLNPKNFKREMEKSAYKLMLAAVWLFILSMAYIIWLKVKILFNI